MTHCTVLCFLFLYRTVLYHIKDHNVTSLADTHLLIKLFMLGPLDKSFMGGGGWVVGGIAIIATSSRVQVETLRVDLEFNLTIDL